MFGDILAMDPRNVEAMIGAARYSRDVDSRLELLQKAVELEPEHEVAQAALLALRNGEEPTWEVEVDNPQPDATEADAAAPEAIVEEIDQPEHSDQQHSEAEPDSNEIAKKINGAVACHVHSGTMTTLRCNRCGKPICSVCAQTTPVGYRCPSCLKATERGFFTARPTDYVLAVMVAFPLSLAAAYLVPFLGFFVLFLAAFAGGAIGRAVRRVINHRRGRLLPHVVVVSIIVGAAMPLLLSMAVNGIGAFAGRSIVSLIYRGLFIFLAAGAAFSQMK